MGDRSGFRTPTLASGMLIPSVLPARLFVVAGLAWETNGTLRRSGPEHMAGAFSRPLRYREANGKRRPLVPPWESPRSEHVAGTTIDAVGRTPPS